MKYFPIKTALFCILVLPFLHTGTVSLLEQYMGKTYRQRIENVVVADSDPLLSGTMPLEEMAFRTIGSFLDHDFAVRRLGVELDIRVLTRSGTGIYPPYDYLVDSVGKEKAFGWDSRETAARNYELLKQGLDVRVTARLGLTTPGGLLVLAVFCLAGSLIFLVAFRRASRRAAEDQEKDQRRIQELTEDEARHREALDRLAAEKQGLTESLEALQEKSREEQKKASDTEEELVVEIVALEEKLKQNQALQEEGRRELEELREKLDKADRRKGGGMKRKNYDLVEKRFSVLYKNLDMNRKAMTGYFSLDPELQIKAEEVIHQLNEDPSKVIVKRKVFAGKKNRSISFEVLFAYTGRLYFRQTDANRVEVLLIGTKNSQDRDMEFLHNL